MYSKDRGITYDSGPFPPRRQPAYRQPTYRQPAYRQPDRPRMQVPPNYSGHAIVDGEERPLGQIGETDPPPEIPSPEAPTPHFDDLPRVSELGDSRRHPRRTVPASFEEAEETAPDVRPADSPSEAVPSVRTPPPSPPAPERPALFDLSRFPFGHGLGLEELLILGLILFLLHESGECSDRGDIDETVILLGLLLLLG